MFGGQKVFSHENHKRELFIGKRNPSTLLGQENPREGNYCDKNLPITGEIIVTCKSQYSKIIGTFKSQYKGITGTRISQCRAMFGMRKSQYRGIIGTYKSQYRGITGTCKSQYRGIIGTYKSQHRENNVEFLSQDWFWYHFSNLGNSQEKPT